MEQALHHSRALSLPNLLTYARLAVVPVIAAILFFPHSETANWVATGLFAAAGVTDFLDGYLARAWQQQSSLGRMLDPIADKLLVGAVLLLLVANQTISGWSLWAALIILSREILVSGLREFLAELNASHAVRVSRLAKWKTAVQMGALCFLVAGPGGEVACGCATLTAGLILLWLAAVLTIYTGADYFLAGLRHVMSEH